jgi:heat shock protein HslJ
MKTVFSALMFGLALLGCASNSPATDEPLTNRYWRVLEIDGQPAMAEDNRPEPHIVLGPEHRTHGSDGCNRFNGSYDDAKGLRFGPLASTRLTCLPAVMNQAQQFMQAAAATVDYRIHGKTLDLLDAAGRVRMRLEVTFLK